MCIMAMELNSRILPVIQKLPICWIVDDKHIRPGATGEHRKPPTAAAVAQRKTHKLVLGGFNTDIVPNKRGIRRRRCALHGSKCHRQITVRLPWCCESSA